MRNKRNHIIVSVSVLALVVSFLVLPVGVKAQAATSSIINSQAKIAELTNQLNSLILQQLITLLTTETQQLQAQLAASQTQTQATIPPSTTSSSTAPTTTAQITATSTVAQVPNNPPKVSITYPYVGLQIIAPASVDVTASALSDSGTISKVEFFDGCAPLGSATKAPWIIKWKDVLAGPHSLTAQATDNKGAKTTSASVSLRVISSETCDSEE